MKSNNFTINSISPGDCSFGYKQSLFQSIKGLIVGADIRLELSGVQGAIELLARAMALKGGRDINLSSLGPFRSFFKGALNDIFGAARIPSTKLGKSKKTSAEKRHFDYPSCGSFFKNNYKIGVPTGELIDRLKMKGLTYGGAMISPYHRKFHPGLYNKAELQIFSGLMDKITSAIEKDYGFIPEPEVVILKD